MYVSTDSYVLLPRFAKKQSVLILLVRHLRFVRPDTTESCSLLRTEQSCVSVKILHK